MSFERKKKIVGKFGMTVLMPLPPPQSPSISSSKIPEPRFSPKFKPKGAGIVPCKKFFEVYAV